MSSFRPKRVAKDNPLIAHTINILKHSNTWLRLAAIKHRLTYRYTYNPMHEGFQHFNHCQNKKPAKVINREISLSKRFWGCYPLFYFRYDLYRDDVQLSEEELLDFIPEFFFHRFFLGPFLENKFDLLLRYKLFTEFTFNAMNIKRPAILGSLINGFCFSPEQLPISPDDLLTLIDQSPFEKIFVKQNDGVAGKGILVFFRNSGGFILTDGRVLTGTLLQKLAQQHNYLIQAEVSQHPAISQIYPGTLNTLQIVTECLSDKPRILTALLNLGRRGILVDNFSKGGLAVGIDSENGKTRDFSIDQHNERFHCHPDTDFAFTGFRIPDWEAVKSFSLENARKFAFIPYIGWDIALTESGPMVIEAHSNLGSDQTQMALGGLRKVYRIDDPQSYWIETAKSRTDQYETYC